MDVKSTMLLLILAVVFVQLPHSSCFSFRETPASPLVVYYSNRTNVEFRWEWTLGSGQVIPLLKIKRYRQNFANTEAVLATYYSSGNDNVDTTKYTLTVSSTTNGYASFVIKDLTNQGNINVMSENEVYVYKIVVDEQTQAKEYSNEAVLNVLRIPYITTYPQNQTASGGTVTFQCAAGGKPPPIITWTKIGSSETFLEGSPLTLSNFDVSKVGVYKCTARSPGITASASGTGLSQLACGSGCSTEELGIEFTNMEYNSNANYEEMKLKIQKECLQVYTIANIRIHICEVPRFRSGSLVAVVKLVWPSNYQGDIKQPLLSAIGDGNFLGYPVRTTFVSPTSPQTQSTPTTVETTQSTASGVPPDSGQRSDEGGLSQGAIIALVVVFSIIFIVIIIVLIVCMLKRKKPKDTRKPYKEAGRSQDKPATTVPLKSQPFDPMYDDPNENRKEVVYADLNFQDRYPNGGGPPPQYTPSSNYAEVRPGQQDDSQVEWDKSVKDEMWI